MTVNLVKSDPFSNEKRWVIIYPSYIDAKKTTKQGRKISKVLAVDNPTSVEIHDVLAASGFNPLLEKNKMYPREAEREPSTQGRVRVQLKNDDGTIRNELYSSRMALYKFVAAMIPKLKTRQPGFVPSSSSGGASSSAAGGKKNKKKK